jgi:phage N-6-adenine-methyltransferase
VNRLAPLMSSARGDWRTPACVLNRVRLLGPIGLDPCSGPGSIVGAAVEWTEADDGLSRDWTGYGLVYCNPPYGRDIGRWLVRCHAVTRCGGILDDCIALVPARTDTVWWHSWVATADAICYWRGRVTFLGAAAPAPFPSAVVYWGGIPYWFASAFADAGRIEVRS